MSLVAIGVVVVAGLLIGATSIGGVLVVPALNGMSGVALEQAVAAAMGGFLLVGIASFALQSPAARRSLREAWPLGGAALLGAAGGAFLLDAVPAAAIRLFIGALAVLSGIHALLARPVTADAGRTLSAPACGGIGLLVGGGSALSGTSGPVILMPLLLALRVPVREAIALALAIQVPIALAASGVNALEGRLDFLLALAVGCILVGSMMLGMRAAAHLNARILKQAVACGLIAFGVAYGYAAL